MRAKSRTDVDALYRKLKKFGAEILDPPAEYPEYGKGSQNNEGNLQYSHHSEWQ